MKIQIVTPRIELWTIDEAFANVPHAHPDKLQITIPIEGVCFFTQDGREHRLAEGGGLVQHPEEEHHFHIENGSGVILIQVLHETLRQFFDRPSVSFDAIQQFDPSLIRRQFLRWNSELAAKGFNDPLAVGETEDSVLSFLYYGLRGSHTVAGPAGEPPEAGRRGLYGADAERHLARALEYMHDRYTERVTIDELAALALQSRFHFIRSFKAYTHQTPYQYLLGLRVQDAKRRLRRTDATVAQISAELGFSSTSQFYRAFARAVGRTPEEYRQASH